MYRDVAPMALTKLRSKNMEFAKLIVKELEALTHQCCGTQLVGLKVAKAKQVEDLYNKNKSRLDQVQTDTNQAGDTNVTAHLEQATESTQNIEIAPQC